MFLQKRTMSDTRTDRCYGLLLRLSNRPFLSALLQRRPVPSKRCRGPATGTGTSRVYLLHSTNLRASGRACIPVPDQHGSAEYRAHEQSRVIREHDIASSLVRNRITGTDTVVDAPLLVVPEFPPNPARLRDVRVFHNEHSLLALGHLSDSVPSNEAIDEQ